MDGRKVKTTLKFQNPNKLLQEEKDIKTGTFNHIKYESI